MERLVLQDQKEQKLVMDTPPMRPAPNWSACEVGKGVKLLEETIKAFEKVGFNPVEEDDLIKRSENGDAEAQCELGVLYEDGFGVVKNRKEAFKWFAKSAEQGNAKAQYRLGMIYWGADLLPDDTKERSDVVAHCHIEAVKWFTESAKQGNARGQCCLGACYAIGKGVGIDPTESVRWWTKAAEQGDAIAQFELGKCYESGIGVSKDVKEAVKWWTKAAEQGNPSAQFRVGVCYYKGLGVTENISIARKWLFKSSNAGHRPARVVVESIFKQQFEDEDIARLTPDKKG